MLDLILECQGQRLEDQRASLNLLPDPGPAGVCGACSPGPPNLPTLDFYCMLIKYQVGCPYRTTVFLPGGRGHMTSPEPGICLSVLTSLSLSVPASLSDPVSLSPFYLILCLILSIHASLSVSLPSCLTLCLSFSLAAVRQDGGSEMFSS